MDEIDYHILRLASTKKGYWLDINIRGELLDRIKELECKGYINPDTKINEQYIMYQCRYAKSKGLKPLSLVKARELLAGMINFD